MTERKKANSKIISVGTLTTDLNNRGEQRIILDPEYQRDIVWHDKDKNYYLSSVFKNLSPSNILFNIDSETGDRTCIDGKQRCTTLLEFRNNKIPYMDDEDGKITNYFYGERDKTSTNTWKVPKEISQKYQNPTVISTQMRTDFLNTDITIVTYTDLTYNEQRDLFQRIQHGKPLSAGEKVSSQFKDVEKLQQFKDLAAKNKDLFNKYLKLDRKQHEEFLRQLLYFISKGNFDASKPEKHINKLEEDPPKFKNYINDLNKLVNITFSKNLLNHKDVTSGLKNITLHLVNFYVYTEKISDKLNDPEYCAILRDTIKEYCDQINKKEEAQKNTTEGHRHKLKLFADIHSDKLKQKNNKPLFNKKKSIVNF
jgi:hypothetical protein